MPKKVPYYSNDRKLFPMTKTEYVKRGSRWVPVSTETEMISRPAVKNRDEFFALQERSAVVSREYHHDFGKRKY